MSWRFYIKPKPTSNSQDLPKNTMPAPGSAPKWPQFGTNIEKGHTKRKKLPREVCFLNIFSPLTWFRLVVNSFRTGLFARYRFPLDLQETLTFCLFNKTLNYLSQLKTSKLVNKHTQQIKLDCNIYSIFQWCIWIK